MRIQKLQFLFLLILFSICNSSLYAQLNLKELLSYPHPSDLCSSPSSGKLAWVFDKEGLRNIFFTNDKGKSYSKLTQFNTDDGQEISALAFSPDGEWLVFFRGGEPSGNWSEQSPVNPTSSPEKPEFQLWSVHLSDRSLYKLAINPDDVEPVISPDSKTVAFINDGGVWTVPVNGAKKPKRLFYTRGNCQTPQWSPDGKKLVFVSGRGDHSFVGIYSDSTTPIHWIDPSFSFDTNPQWSPDGKSVVFIRMPGTGGAPSPILNRNVRPWEIRVAAINQDHSHLIWKSPDTFNGSVPTTQGRFNLHWAANDRIVFLSTMDNWPHLYTVPANGGDPLLLTPGNFMVEYISLSPGGKQILFSANTGQDKADIDRRHIGIVSVDKADMRMLTTGEGIEAYPVFLNDREIGMISSTAYRPPLPAILFSDHKELKLMGEDLLLPVYSAKNLVKPRQVIFNAPDGTPIHAQLFEKAGGPRIKPAIVCIHGGPMRQMLLGWNYSHYYAAHYATNQKLADMGFVVLSVNYRLGIGYGNEFHHPEKGGRSGLSEYPDILAAGKWLAAQSYVDPNRIGVYGGSYGGYLTAFALGKNSETFAAGVDISGVHINMPKERYTTRFEHAPDASLADSIAWTSSPIAFVDTWKSPVLLIHADDDRNVDFNQSIDLLNRLNKKGVYNESLVIPDDTHHWLLFKNLVKVYDATVDFLKRKVMDKN